MPTQRAATRAVVLWSMLALAVDIGLARLGYGLVLPAIRADIHGAYAAYGFVATLHFAGYLVGSLAAPPILQGGRTALRTAAWSHAIVGATLVVSAFAPSIAVLGASRALMGIACGVGVAAVVTGALERVPAAARGAVSGRAWGGLAVGIIVSAPATSWLLGAPDRWRAGTLAVALLAFITAAGLAAAFRAPAYVQPLTGSTETPFRLGDLLDPRRYLLLTLAYVGFGIGYTAYATFVVASLRGAGFGTSQIALVWTAFGVAALGGAFAVGRLVAGPLRRAAFALALGAGAVGSALALIPSAAAAAAGALGVGLGLAASPAIASAEARARSSARTAAAAFVAVTTIMSLGQIAGPLLAGVVADHAGPSAVPLLTLAVYALAAATAALDGRYQSAALGMPARTDAA